MAQMLPLLALTGRQMMARPGVAPGMPETMLTVTGSGEVQVAPDTAQVTLGVTVLAPTAREAQAQASAVLRRIAQVIQALGIPQDQIRTSTISLTPEFEQLEPGMRGTPRVVGYRATATVTVTTSNFDQIGTLIDQAVQAGANEVQGVSFLLRQPEAAQLRAQQAAVADALRKAQALAAGLGLRVVAIRSARVGAELPPRPLPIAFASAQFARAEAVPIFPGTQPVRSEVTLELLAR